MSFLFYSTVERDELLSLAYEMEGIPIRTKNFKPVEFCVDYDMMLVQFVRFVVLSFLKSPQPRL